MAKYTLFIDVMARDNPLDGGTETRQLAAATIEEARIEAAAVVDRDYPHSGTEEAVENYAIAECVSLEWVKRP